MPPHLPSAAPGRESGGGQVYIYRDGHTGRGYPDCNWGRERWLDGIDGEITCCVRDKSSCCAEWAVWGRQRTLKSLERPITRGHWGGRPMQHFLNVMTYPVALFKTVRVQPAAQGQSIWAIIFLDFIGNWDHSRDCDRHLINAWLAIDEIGLLITCDIC